MPEILELCFILGYGDLTEMIFEELNDMKKVRKGISVRLQDKVAAFNEF